MKGIRLLTLRAVRLVRRAPVRSLATGALVAAAVLAGSLWLGEARGHHERTSSTSALLGAAEVRYDLYDDGPVADLADRMAARIDTVVEALPDGAATAVVESYQDVWVGPATVYEPATIHQGPWDDPLLAGMVDLVDGRLPGQGEVVVDPSLARSLGVDLGDQLVVRRPVAALDVVGIGTAGPGPQLVVADGEFVPDMPADLRAPRSSVSLAVLADLPPGADAPEVALGGSPPDQTVATPRQSFEWPGEPPTGVSTGVIVTAALFVGLTAGASFGIGAMRRRRTLGLLAANGATRRQLAVAVGAEAMVVSAPAALVGGLGATVLPALWVRLRLPRWDLAAQLVFPLQGVVVLAVASVAAAVVGAIAVSSSTTASAVTALLDDRDDRPTRRVVAARRTPARALPVLVVVLSVGVAILSGLQGLAVLLVALTWCGVVAGLVAATRLVLSRHAIGRLVARDMVRRPVGAAAAVIVIAAWSFFALMWVVSPNLGGGDELGGVEGSSSATGVDRPGPVSAPAAQRSTTVTIRPSLPTSVRHRSNVAPAADDTALPATLREELASLGLVTQPAIVGEYSGPCEVCPDGFRPTVMVLEGTEGLDLPEATAAALHSGSVVTGFPISGLDAATVGELPVVSAELPLETSAAMLTQFAPAGATLERPVEVLVGSTADLTDEQAAAAVSAIAAAGAEAFSGDERLASVSWVQFLGLDDSPGGRDGELLWLLSLVVPAAVGAGTTVVYRREHDHAAEVLEVLGAGPGAVRQLAGLTAGALGWIGALVGVTSAAIVVAAIVARTDTRVGDVVGLDAVAPAVALLVLLPATARALAHLRPRRPNPPDPTPA